MFRLVGHSQCPIRVRKKTLTKTNKKKSKKTNHLLLKWYPFLKYPVSNSDVFHLWTTRNYFVLITVNCVFFLILPRIKISFYSAIFRFKYFCHWWNLLKGCKDILWKTFNRTERFFRFTFFFLLILTKKKIN